jgi:acylglycerol lipase
LSLSLGIAGAHAQVVREDQADIAQNLPAYKWHDSSMPTRAVVIAVHGVTMHGGVFNTMAQSLASNGIDVFAQDLRGYGRWLTDPKFTGDKRATTIDYESSYSDLVSMIKQARKQYPDIPLFLIGESLGATLTLHAAADLPQDVNGLILSSPAVKIHSLVKSKLECAPVLANPVKQMDIKRYIKKFASEDDRVAEGALNDPLVRKRLSAIDLYRTITTCRPALDYAKKISANIPVLIIQGSSDRMVKSEAVIKLLAEMKSNDQTVRWFRDRGHLLLETDVVRPDTIETVDSWLAERVHKFSVANAVDTNRRLGQTSLDLGPTVAQLTSSSDTLQP